MSEPNGSSLNTRLFARARFAWAAPVLILALVASSAWRSWGTREAATTALDPASVRIVRTPGGMLEVATLQKVEEFGWQVAHTCPLIDCGELLGKTTSDIKVTAHYTYRIALAPQWTLRFEKDHYALVVPLLQAKTPVAFDTAGLQIRTEKGGWLSPAAGPNREAVVRHLGDELARRAERPEYRRLAEAEAAATVAEFARKWMGEQMEPARHPIRVRFAGSELRQFQRADRDVAAGAHQHQQPGAGHGVQARKEQQGRNTSRQFTVAPFA
jgi:hypothetical protein